MVLSKGTASTQNAFVEWIKFIIKKLHGAKVRATDLRSGAALLLAALAAEGETIVEGSAFVERGYEKLEDALTFLGGRVQLVS